MTAQGTADETVPFSEAGKIQQLITQAEVFPIAGDSHDLIIQEGMWRKVSVKFAEFLA